mmetsp:Transcript_60919/g.145178  ORF Transcript_60919/g.145178 Transcript_60919/m.145178 type:complete len:169 (-) Transcript_60919:47-553(-)
MSAPSLLFVVLAALMMAPAAARQCLYGTRTTYSGNCDSLRLDTNTISSSQCDLAEYCNTYGYQSTDNAGCTASYVFAGCASLQSSCDISDALYEGSQGYQCETCSTNDCNTGYQHWYTPTTTTGAMAPTTNTGAVAQGSASDAKKMAAPMMTLFGLFPMLLQRMQMEA